jgi:hypothetical protein
MFFEVASHNRNMRTIRRRSFTSPSASCIDTTVRLAGMPHSEAPQR